MMQQQVEACRPREYEHLKFRPHDSLLTHSASPPVGKVLDRNLMVSNLLLQGPLADGTPQRSRGSRASSSESWALAWWYLPAFILLCPAALTSQGTALQVASSSQFNPVGSRHEDQVCMPRLEESVCALWWASVTLPQ